MGLFASLEKSDSPKFKKVSEKDCVVEVSVEIPAKLVLDEDHNILLRFQQKAKIPGFRPGKAPLELIKTQFAGSIRNEAVDEIIRRFVPQALKDLKIDPVATPVVKDIALEDGKPLRIQVQAEIAPTVLPKSYTQLKLTRKSAAVSEEALNARLKDLLESNARLETSPDEVVASSHYAVIDYTVFRNGKALPNGKGENELVDLSSDQTVEGLAQGLLGLKRGDVKEISVKLEGKETSLHVTLKEIKKKILPALDDEFAKDVGVASLEELKTKLKEIIAGEEKTKSEREMAEQLQTELLKTNEFPVPPSLVGAHAERMAERFKKRYLGSKHAWTEKEQTEITEKLKPEAEKELRMSYLLSAIAEKEKLAIADEEIEAELKRNMEAAKDDAQKEDVRRFFAERREAVVSSLLDRKTMDFLKQKAVITEG